MKEVKIANLKATISGLLPLDLAYEHYKHYQKDFSFYLLTKNEFKELSEILLEEK